MKIHEYQAKAILKAHGVPVTVPDLERHNCLNPSGLAWRGILRGHLSPRRRGWIQGNLNLDNTDALHRVALLGHGIVCLPTFIAGEDLRAGRLVRVLGKQLALEVSAFAIHPQSRHPSPKVRALIDYLAASLGPNPEWDAYKAPLGQRARAGR